jgi:hypothetical protein
LAVIAAYPPPVSKYEEGAAMGVVGVVHAAEIRVLGASGIEDYHAHLMRLDRVSLFPGDDRSIDAHCLDLVASGAILIGAYVKGVMRAGAEIVPDRTARRAEAAITIEHGFQERGFERELTARIIDEARRYHLNDVRVQEQSSSRHYKIPGLELHSYASA